MRAKRAMPGGRGVLCAMGLMTVRPLRICEIVGIEMGEYRKTRCFQRVPVGAPGGTRTHTAQILRLLPLPIGIQGRIQTLSSVQHNRDRVQMPCFAGRLRRVWTSGAGERGSRLLRRVTSRWHLHGKRRKRFSNHDMLAAYEACPMLRIPVLQHELMVWRNTVCWPVRCVIVG